MSMVEARCDKLGKIVYNSVPECAQKILLYAEFGEDVVGVSLFYGHAGNVHQLLTGFELSDELFRLHDQFGPDVRALEFVLVGTKFGAHFTHASSFDRNSDMESRERVVLDRHFGQAPVIPAKL